MGMKTKHAKARERKPACDYTTGFGRCPQHLNCRCETTPVVAFADENGKVFFDRLGKKTRAQCYAQGRADGMREQSALQSQRHGQDLEALQKQVDLLRGMLVELAAGKGKE